MEIDGRILKEDLSLVFSIINSPKSIYSSAMVGPAWKCLPTWEEGPAWTAEDFAATVTSRE
jgi:hypothetical protein